MSKHAARVTAVLALALAAACSSKASPPNDGSSPDAPLLPVELPKDFRLGVATIGYQSEGTIQKNGKRVHSNWSEWEDMGKVENGQHNDRGNGFFDHYDVDLDLSKSLGANAFSYSLDWARIEPAPGVFDEDEAARAVAVVTAMRDRGLRPMIVLFHWVTPAWVQSPVSGIDMLAAKDTSFVDAFIPFVEHMIPKLAGLVDDWVTFEEPLSIIAGEYLAGEHPPGHLLDMADATNAVVNLMYLNARTYHRVHELDTTDTDGDGVSAWVGFENLAIEIAPLDPTSPDDVAAAKHVDYIANDHFLRGVVDGDVDTNMDGVADRHDDTLAHTLDFIGLNYYQRVRVEAGGAFANIAPLNATPHYDVREYDPKIPHGDDYAEISAHGLRVELDAYAKYKLPMMITENGMTDADDDQRPYYTLQHLYEVGNAIRDGLDVRGYFHWTISDNFEWAYGTDYKEGLFAVDFSDPTMPRRRLRSADLFAKIAAARGIDAAIWNEFALPSYPVGIP